MSKTITPTYRIEYRDNDKTHASDKLANWNSRSGWLVSLPTKVSAWDSKSYGKPTQANLEKWRVKMNDSFKHGGINYHVSLAAHVLIHISHARIIRQKTGEIICNTVMPMFEII